MEERFRNDFINNMVFAMSTPDVWYGHMLYISEEHIILTDYNEVEIHIHEDIFEIIVRWVLQTTTESTTYPRCT